MDRTHDGRSVRMLTLIDEYTRECLTIDVARKINAMDVVERWKAEYHTVRPHSSLNYQPPAPEAIKMECLENAVVLS